MLASGATTDLLFFFFNDTATTEIYTLSLHDALPISPSHYHTITKWIFKEYRTSGYATIKFSTAYAYRRLRFDRGDRKSTRLNSSHSQISYAVFCLKKKKDLGQWPKFLWISTVARPGL